MSDEAPLAAVPPPSYRPARRPSGSEPIERLKTWRTRIKWASGVLLVLDVLVLLCVLSLANITSDGPAHRGLEHSVAILTEIDAYLDSHYDGLRAQAELSREDTTDLPDFPIPLSITREELLNSDRQHFRTLVLARAADTIHNDGVSVMRGDRDSETSFVSREGAIRNGMQLLRPTPHRIMSYVTVALAIAAAILAFALVVASKGYGRVLALGLTVLIAAAPFLVLAIALRFALRFAADGADDMLSKEYLELAQELAWAPIRNGIIFVAGSVALLVTGAFLRRGDNSRVRRA
ncbi:MAG: hypothetical protein WEB04_10025 [Dehalococcoidia bacterium]